LDTSRKPYQAVARRRRFEIHHAVVNGHRADPSPPAMSRASGVVVRRAMVDGEDSDELKHGRKEKLGEGEAAAAAAAAAAALS
jgi:hypothetical protein